MSQFIKQSLLASVAALTLVASGAHATTFNFYQTTSSLFDTEYSVLNASSSGVGLALSAVSTNSGAKVTLGRNGIGVDAGLLDLSGDLNDGNTLLLTFNQAVNFSSLGLTSWDRGIFGVGADKVSVTTGGQTFNLTANSGSGAITTFSLGSLNLQGTSFLIKAEGASSFRVANLNVTAVPEAGTSAMLGLGLLGVALAARRQSRKS
jgi:hypothetical protein